MNARHERFAEEVAQGSSQAEAYRRAFPTCHRAAAKTIHERASRFAANGKVVARIAELRAAAASVAVATSRELAEYLTRVIRTPVGNVKPHSDLAAEYEHTPKVHRVKMPSKLDAVDKLARLMGYYAPERTESTLRVSGVDGMTDAELEAIIDP